MRLCLLAAGRLWTRSRTEDDLSAGRQGPEAQRQPGMTEAGLGSGPELVPAWVPSLPLCSCKIATRGLPWEDSAPG